MRKRSKRQILIDGLRLKCPRCGEGQMFSGMFKMRSECGNCHFKFEREAGYFCWGNVYQLRHDRFSLHLQDILRWDYCTPYPFFFRTSFCG